MKRFVFKIIFSATVLCIAAAAFCIASFAEITKQPQSNVFPEYADAFYSCDSDDENAIFRWHIVFEGKDYDIDNADFENDPWVFCSEGGFGTSPDGKSLYFEGVLKQLSGATVYCVVMEQGGEHTTGEAYINIADEGAPSAPLIEVPAKVTATKGEDFSVNVSFTRRDDTTYKIIWYESATGVISDIKAITDNPSADKEALALKHDKTGTYFYCVAIEATKGDKTTMSYSSIIPVTVAEPAETPTPEQPTPTPTNAPGPETPTAPATGSPTESAGETPTGPAETDVPNPTPTDSAPSTEIPATVMPKDGGSTGGWFRTYTIIIIVVIAVILITIVVVSIMVDKKGKKKKKSKGKGKKRR